jgi:molybdopterin/thiamine biosynthesis adenylyltransferase
MKEYFSTQNLIYEFDKDFTPKIFDKSILVVGLGGNGSHIALAAARMGFRKIIGIDKDIVSESNLSRQVLYTIDDLGIGKADAAKKSLLSHNLVSEIETYNFDILSDRKKFGSLVESVSLVFIVLDQPGSTFFAIDTCYQLQKPTIFGGTCIMSGLATRLAWMGPQQRPCLNCSFSSHPSMVEWFDFYKFDNGQNKLKSQDVISMDNKLSLSGGHPSIYPTACIGSNLMISLALNYFMGRRSMPQMIELSILDFCFQEIPVKENKKCPTCS